MDDSQFNRARQVSSEAAWQRLAAPLLAIREVREVVMFAILSSAETDPQHQELLRRVCEVESRLLQKCLARHPVRTRTELGLDHQQSWREVCDFLKDSGQISASISILQFLPQIRQILTDCQLLDADV
jgi:hypothetical protein